MHITTEEINFFAPGTNVPLRVIEPSGRSWEVRHLPDGDPFDMTFVRDESGLTISYTPHGEESEVQYSELP